MLGSTAADIIVLHYRGIMYKQEHSEILKK